ncbi:MAG: TonB-dependent receptor [Longimicrobiales bacterium]
MRSHTRRLLGLAGTLAWALLPAPAAGQAGAVQGRIRDDEGSAVYGIQLRLVRAGTPVRSGGSDRLGFFRMPDVPPGSYTLSATGIGYAEAEQLVAVGPGEVVELELVLERRAVELEGITVGAERSRQRLRFDEVGGATVREMELVDLRKVPGLAEADPLRAVEVLPGVVSTSDFSAAFHVRGGSQDQNLILLDGVPVFSPFHLGGFFSVFNADMLDRAELQSGGFSAEHGGRVSSVLQIESDAGDGRFGVDGGVSLLASRVAVSGGAPRGAARALGLSNIHWKASARRSYFDWLLKPAFEFPYHLQDFQGVAEAWTRGGDRVRVTAYSGDDVLDLTRLDPEDFPLRIDWGWGNDVVGARWTHPRHGGGAVDARVSWSRYGTGLTFPDFGDTEFRSAVSQLQARLDLDLRPSPFLQLRVGASGERMAYDNLAATGGTEFTRGEGSGDLVGAYGQATWSRPRAWLLEAGVRLDHWRPDPGEAVQEVAPRLALKRFFSDGNGALKLAAGRYTQYVHSLRDEDLPLGLDVWVLAGERAPSVVSDQLQAGIEGYPRDDWFLSLEGYLRDFDGVVTLNPADDPNDDLDDILRGTGRSYGADLLMRKEGGSVSGWVAVSYLKARRTFPDMLAPERPAPSVTYAPVFDRRVDADLVLRYPLPWGWEGGLRWNVGTGTPYTRAVGAYALYSPRYVDRGGRLGWDGADEDTDELGGYAVQLGERNGSRYPVYHRLDVSARKTVRTSWGTVVPYVDVLNTYNRRNVLFYFYEYSESPPVRSGISMFPLLPTFGVEIHF